MNKKARTPRTMHLFFRALTIIDFIFLSPFTKSCLMPTTFSLLSISREDWSLSSLFTLSLMSIFSYITLTESFSCSVTYTLLSPVLIISVLEGRVPINSFLLVSSYQSFSFLQIYFFSLSQTFLCSFRREVLAALVGLGCPNSSVSIRLIFFSHSVNQHRICLKSSELFNERASRFFICCSSAVSSCSQVQYISDINLNTIGVRSYIYINRMSFQRSLSPAQIQYLRIGPKAGSSEESRKHLIEAINSEKNKELAGDASMASSLNKIPKLTYGEFERTVSNFGVLINKNFGNETSVHQSQKFGKMAAGINRIMLQEKDKPMFNEKKNALLKKIKDRSDNRTSLKAVYDWHGQKIHATLKSFCVESDRTSQGGLPMPYLRFLVNKVNSARLVKIIEPALKTEGNQIVVEFDKIESRAGHLANSEAKYQNIDYTFERLGQQFTLSLPYLEFQHSESGFSQKVHILNKELLETLDSNFDNVQALVEKYLQVQALENALAQTSKVSEEPEEDKEA